MRAASLVLATLPALGGSEAVGFSAACEASGDGHKDAEVRRALALLVSFAQELDAASLGIGQVKKGSQGQEPLERISGSLAFGAVPRLVWAAAKKITAEGIDEGRILVRVKSNIGLDDGGVGYTLEEAKLANGIVASRVKWGGTIAGNAREILASAEQPLDPERVSKLDAAKEWLREYLANGPRLQTEIETAAEAAGHKGMTLRRAADKLGVVKEKQACTKDGAWTWKLPEKGGE